MKKPTNLKVVNDINVTPMVDVMLVMLIIFMVITPMLQKGVSVDKVRTENPMAMQDADKDDAVLISVTKNGETFLGNTRIPMDQIPTKVKDMLTNQVKKTCYVSADRRARYEKVAEVVDALRSSGVDDVGLITDQDQDAARRRRQAAGAGGGL
jgi:biopolymer transport protein ExbD/biopolymer transport protein TolR